MTVERRSRFDHLLRMTDHHGLFEHAEFTRPRPEHGYCTDDNARLLVVTSREVDAGAPGHLSRVALAFVIAAQTDDGRTHNRMNSAGTFTDAPSHEDCWGRSLWALGTAAANHDDPLVREAARTGFDRGLLQRSAWARSMAFAALGAVEVVGIDPTHVGARALLRDAAIVIGVPGPSPWVWPEPRLRYANAALAEAMIAIGAALEDWAALDAGLAMLGWLLDRETARGHLSVTGTDGAGPAEIGPSFDQQPIEVAAMADACWRARAVTGNSRWAKGVESAGAWFEGRNDVGAVMYDERSAGGFDGLRHDGVNLNQGAESTLAFVSTMQRVDSLQEIHA